MEKYSTRMSSVCIQCSIKFNVSFNRRKIRCSEQMDVVGKGIKLCFPCRLNQMLSEGNHYVYL